MLTSFGLTLLDYLGDTGKSGQPGMDWGEDADYMKEHFHFQCSLWYKIIVLIVGLLIRFNVLVFFWGGGGGGVGYLGKFIAIK